MELKNLVQFVLNTLYSSEFVCIYLSLARFSLSFSPPPTPPPPLPMCMNFKMYMIYIFSVGYIDYLVSLFSALDSKNMCI